MDPIREVFHRFLLQISNHACTLAPQQNGRSGLGIWIGPVRLNIAVVARRREEQTALKRCNYYSGRGSKDQRSGKRSDIDTEPAKLNSERSLVFLCWRTEETWFSSFRRVRSAFCQSDSAGTNWDEIPVPVLVVVCGFSWNSSLLSLFLVYLSESGGFCILVQFYRVEIDASLMFLGTIQSPCKEGEDIFFDTMDSAQISSDSSLEEASVSEFRNWLQVNAIWTDELRSISERRKRFMKKMGLNELDSGLHLILDNPEIREESCRSLDLERMTKNSGAEIDSLSPSDDGCEWNSDRTIRDLDSGKKFLVHEFGQDGLPSFLKEAGSDRLMTLKEFEKYLGISFSVQMFVHGENNIVSNANGEEDSVLEKIEPKSSSWWKLFAIKSAKMSTNVPRTVRMRVQYNWKRCVEFTAVYQGQEIQGHEGSINAMKFSPDGRYLATGGEDKIVRIWSVDEVNASCNSLFFGSSTFWLDKPKVCKIKDEKKCSHSVPVVIPKRIFKLGNKPVQELHGHTNDILDISWSKYNCLLTASKDKTARIWQVGCGDCMQIFQHNDYVTCIQFDPVDNGYFITGSIDGKIRKWGVNERRVIEWTDVRDIVTAVSYRPNGQGFVVGTITGSCHFYTSSGNNLQLGKQLFIQGKKKSAGKMITGFQFAPDDPEKVMITSADSKIRIVDGADVIQKYRGPRKSKRQLFASFTEDGRHIISVGDDSSIYIWNCKRPNPASSSSKNSKLIRSCEHFFSKDVSIALPWPGIDRELRSISSTNKSEYYKKRESSFLRDLDRVLVRGWFFGESFSRGSISTWPEEKLTQWPEHTRDSELSTLASPYTTWSRVIVAADISGSIRVYHNYGLPVRL